MKRAAIVVVGGALALGLLVVVEVLLARRGERIDPFPAAEVGGVVGEGQPALRLVWLGDSTGVGVGSSSANEALPRMVARAIGRRVDLTVLAVSGARIADVIRDQAPRVNDLDPDWIVVAISSNDVVHLTRLSEVRAQMARLLDTLRASNAERVVVVGPGHFAGTPRLAQPLRYLAGRRARQVNAVIRVVATERRMTFVNIIERVGGRFVGDPARYHAPDRFHPSDAGYALWAEAIVSALREAGAIARR